MDERILATLRVPGRADSLRLIRALVRDAALSRGASPEWAHDLVMAVDEACQNVIRHGYGEGNHSADVVIDVAGDDEGMCVRITDFAAPVDPATIRARDLSDLRPGGLGVHLIRALTDECAWEAPPPGAGNVLRLRKRLCDSPVQADELGKGEQP